MDGFDLLELTLSFGATPVALRFNPRADINDDGVVDGWDLGILGANYVRTSL